MVTKRALADIKISVIIPFYNHYSTIFDALNSIKDQLIKPFEVIIIDDASSDEKKLKDCISHFKKHLQIILIRNTNNSNGAYSRNRGIKKAKGNLIAFLDADDFWMPNKISAIIDKVIENGSENIFFSKVKMKYKDKIIGFRPSRFSADIHISEYLFLDDGFIQTSSIVCSKKIAEQVMFNEKFQRHQDYDFVLRAFQMGITFKFINKELVVYRADIKPNLNKGEGYNFSKKWLSNMRKYMNEEGYWGFIIFSLTNKLIAERNYKKALFNLIKNLPSMRLRYIPKVFIKLSRLFIVHVKY